MGALPHPALPACPCAPPIPAHSPRAGGGMNSACLTWRVAGVGCAGGVHAPPPRGTAGEARPPRCAPGGGASTGDGSRKGPPPWARACSSGATGRRTGAPEASRQSTAPSPSPPPHVATLAQCGSHGSVPSVRVLLAPMSAPAPLATDTPPSASASATSSSTVAPTPWPPPASACSSASSAVVAASMPSSSSMPGPPSLSAV
mmetsp:Transcript_8495/g.24969  ORF Transcript_8495/g.24969 Transcript_8495/m.24969 type:complete len:202 (+) Transcript_8495:223-828(+)